MAKERVTEGELPGDNAARIAIYDAFAAPAPDGRTKRSIVSDEELLELVMGRLRVLVPREIHIAGDPAAYLREKISACIGGGLMERVGPPPGLLRLTGVSPRIRYPDGELRDYQAGMEPARERLQMDDTRLRAAKFDVHKLVPSISKRSADFKALVESMREHGYLAQYPVAEGTDGVVVDGRARVAAAASAGVEFAKTAIPTRRDTPLHRALLVLDTNRRRISEEQRAEVLEAIASITGREWPAIAADLALTREWRRPTRRKKSSYKMQVTKLQYRPDQKPKVHVTDDGSRVMLRSLVQAAGLAGYKINKLKPYAPMEPAKSNLSPRALFVRVADAIDGIEAMQREDRAAKRLVEAEWDEIRTWLIKTSADGGAGWS